MPAPDDFRRVVVLAVWVDEQCRNEGVDPMLDRLARCTREVV